MKQNIFQFDASADAVNIECDIYDAAIHIRPSENDSLSVVFPAKKNIDVAAGDGNLIIKQSKRPLACFKQTIEVCVSKHIIPNITVYGRHPQIIFSDGIYGDLAINCEGGKIELLRSVFSSVLMTTGAEVHIADATVKGMVLVQSLNGDVIVEKTFAPRAEFRLKKGNLGLVEMNCKECVLKAGGGNISAAFCGNECEYATALKSDCGICNMESRNPENAEKVVKAYADGNITIQFDNEDNPAPREAAATSPDQPA